MKKRVALLTLGCKVNSYETEAMQELLEENDYKIIPFSEIADVYIVNTCTVTNMADKKSRQMLHKAKKLNPNAIVVAAGCYAQVKEKEALDPCIDIVIGNNKKHQLISILKEVEENKQKDQGDMLLEDAFKIDINDATEFEELRVTKTAEHTRAYVKVQDGCNQFCSYCIIPYARGRVRSRLKSDVIDTIQELANNGYKEVVLTGIHLSSYGVDFKEPMNLLNLIEAVHEIDGIERIRLGSLEPRIITEDFVDKISKLEKVCAHFHLSLQSGCDETLKRMNRRYTTKEYRYACDLLRKAYKFVTLTTDIIVGFPGETEEEFQKTKEFVDAIGFYETHIFKYSVREGTKAAAMSEQIQESIKTRRSNEMQELNKQQQEKIDCNLQGQKVSILIEEKIEQNNKVIYSGHTKEYVKVAILDGEYLVNQVISNEIGEKLQILH